MTDNRTTGRDAAILAAGLAAGVLGSRLLPPLVAIATGAIRARRSQDRFDVLIRDHRMIESLLKQMAATPADSHAKRTSLYLLLKRKLANHIMAEEDIVYPLLHEEVMERDRSQILYEEHEDMKVLLHELEECLTFRSDWHEPLERLRSLIHEHINEEEQVVFPRVRDLGSEKLPDMSGQIHPDEALVL